jgi:hypothetical protein
MAGLVPAIHVFVFIKKQDVDARAKRGHEDSLIPFRSNVGALAPGIP